VAFVAGAYLLSHQALTGPVAEWVRAPPLFL
jgi:hypothetical protein